MAKKKTVGTKKQYKVFDGMKAPLFKTINQNEKAISLKDLRGQKVILYFYPKDMTPGCTQESCDFRDAHSQFKKQKIIVLGVSKDTPELHKKFISKYELPFDLIVDSSGAICESYDVIQEKNMYGKKYKGIERTTFLIDEDGIILKRYSKVKVDNHVDLILNDLKTF